MLETLFVVAAADKISRSNQAQTEGAMAAQLAREAKTENQAIIADVEKIFLVTQALWALLKEEHGYTEETLQRKILEADLQDGKLDGKIAKTPNPDCPNCGRKLMGHHPLCLYCGATVMRDPFER